MLTEPVSRLDRETLIVPWLGEVAKAEMVQVARGAFGEGPDPTPARFEQIFQCDPAAEYQGFGCWDDFFTRTFRPGVRPVSAPEDDGVIVSACESAPLQVTGDVSLSDRFWLKGQPYSLDNMLDFDETGSIGKRYRREDEIGTPMCITVDFDTLETGVVTVRDRDTMEQDHVHVDELVAYIQKKIEY